MHDVDWSPIVSALTSGGIVAVLARAFLHRTLGDLDDLMKKITVVSEKLAVITVRLEAVESHYQMLQEHDRKIVAMEQRFASR